MGREASSKTQSRKVEKNIEEWVPYEGKHEEGDKYQDVGKHFISS